MNGLRVIWCRLYQHVMALAMYFLPFNEPELHEGVASIPGILKARGYKNPLIVTDPSIYKLGLTKPLEDELKKAGISYSLYSDVVANPTFPCVYAAEKVAKDGKCDSIIALGGGSSIDTAKAVGALLSNPKKDIKALRGTLKVTHRYHFLLAIPTTAGTGSEATVAAVVVNPDTHEKFSINDPKLIPQVAVHDDTLLKGLPPKVISTTGMDALTHAVEAYIGHSRTSKTKRYSLEATKLISEYLFRFYTNPADDEARKQMLKASYLAGVSFTRSYVGYVHAIAHSLGGQYNVPHGLANAVILPHVLRAFGKKAEKPLADLAIAAGVGKEGEDVHKRALAFIAWIEEMNKKMAIPVTFDHLIKPEDIAVLSKRADKEANPLYPVPKEMDADELAKLYKEIDPQ